MGNAGFKIFFSLALFAFGSTSLEAAAADDRTGVEKARAHFEHGERLYKVSRYREALEAFKEGYVAKADPVFLFNIAQCHRLLGDRDDALTFYRRYLQADQRTFRRPEVERRIHDLEAQQAADPTYRTAPTPAAIATPALASARASSPAGPTAAPMAGPAVGSLAAANPSPPAPAATALILTARPEESAPAAPPLYRRWWLWTGLGVVAVAVTTTLLLSRAGEGPCGANIALCERL